MLATNIQFPVVIHRMMRLESMVITIAHLPAVGNTRFSDQLRRNVPNILWFINQSCHLFDPLAKQKAAATVGVLQGIPGVTRPMYAIPRHIMPSVSQMAFLILDMELFTH